MRDFTGMPHVLPTHQGRASERILFELLGGPGKVVPSNNHFDTTRANIQHSGAEAVDLVIPEGTQPRNRQLFEGNVDVGRLDELLTRLGPERVPVVMVAVTNNSGGGPDPATGKELHPPMELVRLAVPRRVYTQSHIDCVVDAVAEVHARRGEVRGLRIVEAPPVLRHFSAKFAEL